MQAKAKLRRLEIAYRHLEAAEAHIKAVLGSMPDGAEDDGTHPSTSLNTAAHYLNYEIELIEREPAK